MRARLVLCTTLLLLCHPQLRSQTVTMQLPPASTADAQAGSDAHAAAVDDGKSSSEANLPDDPSMQSSIPEAHVVPMPQAGVPVELKANTQSYHSLEKGNLYTLEGDVVIHYRDYIVHADKATYNDATGEIVGEGHLMVDGGPDDEHFEASHGTVNAQDETGHFYDVVGTLGVQMSPKGKVIFTSPNPYALTGREILQLGPKKYHVIHGTMTSCRLPDPDWRLFAQNINVANGKASAANSIFELLKVPLFYLPYVNHPVGEDERATGILIPVFSIYTNSTKGYVFGEGVYVTLGRSADFTFASQYYSKRGFAPNGNFRYKGRDENFVLIRFHSLLDRGLQPGNINQGGIDVVANGRYDFSPNTRGVAELEYLSRYIYRLTFEENYAIAINSEVKSDAFLTHSQDNYTESLRINRYQNFENATTGEEVRILHLPQVDVDGNDRYLPGTPFMWGYSGSVGTLSRFDFPNFRTSSSVPRMDVHPHLNAPLHFGGWNFRPEVAVRDTFYGKSQDSATLNEFPTVRSDSINRADFEAGVDIHPPALERDFTAPWLEHLLGGELRHTIEPQVTYRYVTGVNNFRQVLRFDDVDIASNTNEVEYSLTQRLFLRHLHPHPCKGDDALGPEDLCGGGTVDWLSWRVGQKYFLDPNFGHAVTRGTPNPLATTLDFSGVDFLTAPRSYSPIISRLHMRTTSNTDAEWDLDYDSKAGRVTSSNVYAGFNHGNYRFQFGDAYLNSPLGVQPGTPLPDPRSSNYYNQIHAMIVYGSASKLGLSAGATTGYDVVHEQLQYGAVQAIYNWNCCGIGLELRRFSLSNIRDDTEYMYSFSLAGFGALSDISRAARVF
jgi:LPS-assembly protein